MGNLAAAAEYDKDTTPNVDHAADTGLKVGCSGGEAAPVGIFGETPKVDMSILVHSNGKMETVALEEWWKGNG